MSDVSLASDVPMEDVTFPAEDISPSPSSALHVQATRDPVGIPAGDTVLPGVLLQEARRHLDCSLGTVGTGQHHPSSVPKPRDTGASG